MSHDEWVRRLSALVRKYPPSTSGATFRNGFKAVLDAAAIRGQLTKEDADLFTRVRAYLAADATFRPEYRTALDAASERGQLTKHDAELLRRAKDYLKDVLAFRNEYRAVVDAAVERGHLTKQDADLLMRARSYLEAWAGPKALEPDDVYAQWIELHEARGRIPSTVLEAFLGHLPKDAAARIDWSNFVLALQETPFLTQLLKGRVLTKAQLLTIAKARPSEFYLSAATDVLIRSGTPCPRPVWDSLASGQRRSTKLLDGAEALVLSFAADRKPDAIKWLVGFLARAASVRQAILANLLRDTRAALRLAAYLTPVQPPSPAEKKRKEPDFPAAVAIDWIAACDSAMRETRGEAATASIAFGLMILASLAAPKVLPPEVLAVLSEKADSIAERTVRLALQSGESDGALRASSYAVTVRGEQLYSAVQAYLRNLPVGAKGDESPERALRYERYLGRREALAALISAMDGSHDEGSLRDKVEVALFNAGVRELGSLGEQVPFDAHFHELDVAGVLPGSLVVITRPGRRLGEDVDGIVLVKARVKPLEQLSRTA